MGLLSSIGGVFGNTASSVGNFLNKGGGTFKNPFLSIKGQEERLGNVAKTLGSAFTFGGVQTNRNIIKNETIAKTLETAGSHPLITAGVITGGVYAARAAIPAVTKLLGGAGTKAVIAGGGGAAAVIPKASGILSGNKTSPAIQQYEQEVKVAENPQVVDTITQAVLAKKDNKTQLAAASSLLESIGGSQVTGHKVYRRKYSRIKKRLSKRMKKRSNKRRKLKFGSKAFRKKYLGHHKRHKKAKHHKKNKLKFGSPAYRRKYLGHK